MAAKEHSNVAERIAARAGPEGEWSVALSGRWGLEHGSPDSTLALPTEIQGVRRIRFEDAGLGAWDSSLILFLLEIADFAEARGIEIDTANLPAGACRLLSLARLARSRTEKRRDTAPPALLERIGRGALRALDQVLSVLSFLGQVVQAFSNLAVGRARLRPSDLALFVQQTGAEALPIVTLISVLAGLILAFVGSVQLATFGAQIYVADAVAIGMLRQMGAMMTAIIIAGRTGAAYAAQLGSMLVNEEIDAFKTLGIDPVDFLVLPRLLALVLMLPLLTIYADAVGIFGGVLVGVGIFDIPLTQYLNQTREAASLQHLSVGLIMSLVFAVIIAVAGCYQGLRSGRSSAAVGDAATKAVVSAIVGIVVADAVVTLLITELGI
jgi:phospholipid/cholesterol/gamma-HCH transport system permease protein